MSKTRSKYITALNYSERNLLVLSDASSGVSLSLFATVFGETSWIAKASISLV